MDHLQDASAFLGGWYFSFHLQNTTTKYLYCTTTNTHTSYLKKHTSHPEQAPLPHEWAYQSPKGRMRTVPYLPQPISK